ncbi:DUF4167 domain-containing protein [Cohaesibacter haloalkalitolerans]|uniref:DUF4167 domain-containing protein n=1 Tax=Cohaesibacter haloalkalitolerans TaxID=1162980 RepID=UPI000E64EB0D|nr:DUF4167 domain-containing protein [Cohaesibacter haloalkalitolerans]
MRQSQKSSRTRSRGRKPSNPLSRSYDSNGPDVKIRGTASHIAEKYQSLARDAQASGDMVMAENYYQHAEHYLRIIAAAQPATREEMRPVNGSGEQPVIERSSRKSSMSEITGDEPQPDINGFEDTAVEMEVAVFDPQQDDDGDDSDQPDIPVVAESDKEDDGKAAPRRRRRTTYRSRKKPAGADKDGEGASAVEGPQPVIAED